jgi:hypothetical protein
LKAITLSAIETELVMLRGISFEITECAYESMKMFLLMFVLVYLTPMRAIRAILSISRTEHHGRRMHGVGHYKMRSEATRQELYRKTTRMNYTY